MMGRKDIVLHLKTMAMAQWSMALCLHDPNPRSRFNWMRRPHPGDVVVETSAAFRHPKSADGVGTLVSRTKDPTEGWIYKVALLHRNKTIKWSNCSFIRPICTPEQERLLSVYSSHRSDVERRAHMIPWCSTQRHLAYEDVGYDATNDAWLFRCRGCGHRASRRRFLDNSVEPCPTCHVPEPTPVPCAYCDDAPL
jgi:hypothetical protein